MTAKKKTSERIIEKFLGDNYTGGIDPAATSRGVNTSALGPTGDVAPLEPPPRICAGANNSGGCSTPVTNGTHCDSCVDMMDHGPGDKPDVVRVVIRGEVPRVLPKTTALTQYFGSNRTLAEYAGNLVGDVDIAFVPFFGAGCEIPFIRARQIIAGDLHEDQIRLARIVRDPELGPRLQNELRSAVFHPAELEAAQHRLRAARLENGGGLFNRGSDPTIKTYLTDLARARDYFIACWMGRSSSPGTDGELEAAYSVRYTASGGGSAVRFQSAIDSISPGWAEALRRCEFVVLDFEDLLMRVEQTIKQQQERAKEDRKKPFVPDRIGVYCDPPFPGPGDDYKHKMTTRQQRSLASWTRRLATVFGVRVVMRFYDHPLVRELYPEEVWTWNFPKGGRDQHNNEKPEVFLVAGGAKV